MTKIELIQGLIELCMKADKRLILTEGRSENDEWNIENARDTLQEVVHDLQDLAQQLEQEGRP